MLPESEVALRRGLETLEHTALTLRALARAIIDSSRIESEAGPIRDSETRTWLATVLGQLAEAVRTYGRLLQTPPMTELSAGPRAGRAASLGDSEELEAGLQADTVPRPVPRRRRLKRGRRSPRHQELPARRPRDISKTR